MDFPPIYLPYLLYCLAADLTYHTILIEFKSLQRKGHIWRVKYYLLKLVACLVTTWEEIAWELVVRVNRHLVFSSNPLFISWRKIREGIEDRIHIPFWCEGFLVENYRTNHDERWGIYLLLKHNSHSSLGKWLVGVCPRSSHSPFHQNSHFSKQTKDF